MVLHTISAWAFLFCVRFYLYKFIERIRTSDLQNVTVAHSIEHSNSSHQYLGLGICKEVALKGFQAPNQGLSLSLAEYNVQFG